MSEARNLVPVLAANTDGKPLTIVRPSKLAKDGITGIVAEGLYLGTQTNPFDAEQVDFKVEGEDTLFIINSAGSLTSQLGKVETGSYVQIQYMGKQKAKSGKAAGKMVHNFQVLVEG
jgi:hypothetical protein